MTNTDRSGPLLAMTTNSYPDPARDPLAEADALRCERWSAGQPDPDPTLAVHDDPAAFGFPMLELVIRAGRVLVSVDCNVDCRPGQARDLADALMAAADEAERWQAFAAGHPA